MPQNEREGEKAMEEERPDSEQFLKRLKYEEREQEKKTRGRLKIFLGYAAGSGKPTLCWKLLTRRRLTG